MDRVTLYQPVPGKIPGTTLNLGGHELVLAPLNLDQVQAFEATIANLGQPKSLPEAIAEAVPLIHASLSRNYPDLSVEDVRRLVDLGNFAAACTAIVTSSGFKRAAPGESSPPTV
jgi:hypothetical protein